jgi:hypothetical protein
MKEALILTVAYLLSFVFSWMLIFKMLPENFKVTLENPEPICIFTSILIFFMLECYSLFLEYRRKLWIKGGVK